MPDPIDRSRTPLLTLITQQALDEAVAEGGEQPVQVGDSTVVPGASGFSAGAPQSRAAVTVPVCVVKPTMQTSSGWRSRASGKRMKVASRRHMPATNQRESP
jgi:hypothetical protein